MPVYIKGAACISPQPTWEGNFLNAPVSYSGNRLTCIEPDYYNWLEVKQLRRMSHVMKIGTVGAMLALKDAGVAMPDGIIAGTGWGCLEDTGFFLERLITNKEDALSPTPFIQSTHNTISSHIALLFQCQGYNQTYSHGSFSFEGALLDALLHISESPDQNILVGGVDEITNFSHQIQNRFGIFKKNNADSLQIFNTRTKGTLHGEGTAWFVLSGRPSASLIEVAGFKTLFKTMKKLHEETQKFLDEHLLENNDIDFLLLGSSGDFKSDKQLGELTSSLFPSSSTGYFKHLCGEYPVASSFALWLGYSILENGRVPWVVMNEDRQRPVKTILILNQFYQNHHSLILLKLGE